MTDTTPDTAATTPLQNRLWLGPLMVGLGAAFVGLAPIGLRLGLDDLGAQAIAFWRYTFALPVIMLLVIIVHKRLPARPNFFIVLAGLFFALDIALWHHALTKTTVANATFIVNLGSVSVGFLAWIFLKDRPQNLWFFAVLLAIAGAAALSLGGARNEVLDPVLRATSTRGDMIACVAAFMIASYLLFSKLGRRSMGGLDAIFWLTFVEIGAQGLIVLSTGEAFFPEKLSGFSVPLFLAIFVQICGQGLIIAGIGRTPASIAGVLIMMQPVVAAAISWNMFGEPLSAIQIGGACTILAAVWLAQFQKPATIPVTTP